MNSAIELSNVGWKAGESFELKDLSLRVPTGSIYGFLGPNGSGKTTTIRMLSGVLRPDHGEIRIFGKSVPRDMKAILSRVGYVPERPHIYPSLTVGEQVKVHSSFYDLWDHGSMSLPWRDRYFSYTIKRPLLGLRKSHDCARVSDAVGVSIKYHVLSSAPFNSHPDSGAPSLV